MVENGQRRIDRLIVISAASLGSAPIIGVAKLFSPRFINPLIPPLLSRTAITLVLRVAFGTPGRPTSADVDQYWATTQFDEGGWACRALLHRFTFDRVPDATLRALRIPVLAILGGCDRLVLGGGERAALIPNSRTVTIPEGGHLVMQECAARANAEILDFLATR
jgi:pimeloyl-ACP methyl ester carboxylesterase